jgi:uncharacterized protein YjiS (DUF1127 family)
MTKNIPILPIGFATMARVFAGMSASVARWSLAIARARRHRREARALAGLDRHMLADMGITRADLRDAFSGPFWEDPTALLRERVLERRRYRTAPPLGTASLEPSFHRPPANRPARQAV